MSLGEVNNFSLLSWLNLMVEKTKKQPINKIKNK
jgi:hypothetical protein